MTDTSEAKKPFNYAGVPLWRRLLLAVGNISVFVVLLLLAPWIQSLAGEGTSRWGLILLLLIPLVALDWLLQMVFLRPARSSHAEPGTNEPTA